MREASLRRRLPEWRSSSREAPAKAKRWEGQPAAVLLKEAEQADMIVVGSRGRGGFANLLLGSVTQQVVHHAPCPVVVVR